MNVGDQGTAQVGTLETLASPITESGTVRTPGVKPDSRHLAIPAQHAEGAST
jgi:hypothetical protein